MTDSLGELMVRMWRAHRQKDPQEVYDEVLREVSARAAAEGSLGKAEIGALVLWKRITAQTEWTTELMLNPDRDVRQVTEVAYRHSNDETLPVPQAGLAAREALFGLPGMGGTAAFASAVLLALAPTRMAVWNRRGGSSLAALGRRPKSGAGFYGRYLETLTELVEAMNAVDPEEHCFVPRDVDLALYAMAASEESLSEARAFTLT